MSEFHETTGFEQAREARLQEARLALEDAQQRGAVEQIPRILAEYPDLQTELQALIGTRVEATRPVASPVDPLQVLAALGSLEDYVIIGEIASGGWGEVVRARHSFLGREVAIKVLKSRLAGSQFYVQRFLEEAQIASHLQHPGIAPIHEVGRLADGRPGFVMKLVDGRTLAELLQKRTSPGDDLARFLEIFLQICRTLAYAHRTKGVLHRDLKPLNVMVGAFNEVQVMDWGLGKVVHGAADEPVAAPIAITRPDDLFATQHGTPIGTPAYMPPEQARGELSNISPRSDVFGLGAILCEILTGKPPYTGTRDQVEHQARTGNTAEALARLKASAADEQLIELACRCLTADPTHRPADAAEVASAIEAYQQGLQEKLRQQELERVNQNARRRTRRVVIIGTLLLLAGTGAFAARYIIDETAKEKKRATEEAVAAVREQDVRKLLAVLNVQLKEERWDAARETRRDIQGRLADGGPEELKQAAHSAQLELDFIEKTEFARLQYSFRLDGLGVDDGSVEPLYGSAFSDYGLNLDSPAEAVVRIRSSPIRPALLAALYAWAFTNRFSTHDKFMERIGTVTFIQAKLLAIADGVSQSTWSRMICDPKLRRTPAPLIRAIHETTLEEMSAVELGSLAIVMMRYGGDVELFLRRCLRIYPGDYWLNILLGMNLHFKAERIPPGPQRRVRYEEAACYVRVALGSFSRSPLARKFEQERTAPPLATLLLGQMLIECDRFDEAESTLVQRMRRTDGVVAYQLQALCRLRRGNLLGAENVCHEALRFGSHLAYSHELLGEILLHQGRPDDAVASFNKAASIPTQELSRFLSPGIALMQIGKFDDATKALRRPVRPLHPHDETRRLNLLKLLETLAALDRSALSACEDGTFKPKSDQEALLAAEMCLSKGKAPAALRLFEQTFAKDPTHADKPSRLFPPISQRCLAARAAVVTAKDAKGADRAKLRDKALNWLRDDVESLRRLLTSQRLESAAYIRMICGLLLHHPDLATVRGPKQPSNLPDEEWENWQTFWKDVEALLKDAATDPATR